jgi:plastocyanin
MGALVRPEESEENLMRITTAWLLALAATAGIACSSNSTGPGNGGGGGGAVGTVTVGNIFFQSGHNGTKNPAIDTVAAGTAVTWTWTNTGSTSHSVESEGTPSFTSSQIQTGSGKTYSVTFTTPGTYEYECAVHGAAMTGRIVVQ